MATEAVIVHGGWDGHQPHQVAEIFASVLRQDGFLVHESSNLDTFLDQDLLGRADLLIPIWTMGKITSAQVASVSEAAARDLGLADSHGGMCDAFRNSTQWQFLTGGNFVAHPGGDRVEYVVNLRHPPTALGAITADIDDFPVPF